MTTTAPLVHITEPQALLLVWQGSDEANRPSRTRRVVGKITHGPGETAELRYLIDSADFAAAAQQGFTGYPGFPSKQPIHASATVLQAMLRRLPPRKREDFADYLAQHRLPSPFPYSDFALLGYTEARLPSDGFSLVPVFDPDATPCDYILEAAGTRYHCDQIQAIVVGDTVELQIEENNPVEPGAIAIFDGPHKLGYVNRALLPTVSYWLKHKTVRAQVERKNGKPERPLIYIRLRIE